MDGRILVPAQKQGDNGEKGGNKQSSLLFPLRQEGNMGDNTEKYSGEKERCTGL